MKNKKELSRCIQKKILILITLFCLSLLCFNGCGSPDASNKTTKNTENVSKTESVTEIEEQFNMLDISYIENEDGTYTCLGGEYKYKLIVTDENDNTDSSFLILANDENISYRTVGDGMASSQVKDEAPEFVILGMK